MYTHSISVILCGALFSPLLLANTSTTAGTATVSGSASPEARGLPRTAPTRLSQAELTADQEQAQQDYLESLTREAARSDRTETRQSSGAAEPAPAVSEQAPPPRTGPRRFDAIRSIVSEALAEPEEETAAEEEPEKQPSAPVAKRRERLQEVVISAPPPQDSPGENYISVLKEEVSTTVVVTPGTTSTVGGPAPKAATRTSVYTVRNGDSLWTIAERIYGSGYRWAAIYDANRQRIADANVLLVGQRLEIPE